MKDKKIHVTSEIKACSRYVNEQNAWIIKDNILDKLADRLINLLTIPDVIVNEAKCKHKGACSYEKCVIAICPDFWQKESEVAVCKYKAMHNYWKNSEDCKYCPECGVRL